MRSRPVFICILAGMKLHTINTGFFKLDGGAMFGVVPKSMWSRLNVPDERNLCTWAMRCLLIEDGKQLILIDCGLGNKQDAKFFSHYEPHGEDSLEKSLRAKGYDFSDVTDVVLSHLHFDHCGGAVKREGERLLPVFPNAVYWSNAAHWDWAVNPNPREKASFLKENILPLQESGQLRFAESGSRELHPEIALETVSGHTESMFVPHISYKGKTLVYMADLMPSVAHVPVNYVMAYDTRPLLTMEEKGRFLKKALEEKYVLFFEHDALNECAVLDPGDGRVRAGEIFRLEEW